MMLPKQNKFLKVLILFIIIACQNSEDSDPNAYYATIEKVGNHEIIVCDVGKINRKTKIPLSKLVDNCEIVFPETIEQSLYSRVQQAAVSQNYIGIVSPESPVKLFNIDGSFVCNIGNIGRGPAEYSNLNGIQIEEESNLIYLTPLFFGEKIQTYNLNGDFKGDIPLVFKQNKCKVNVVNDTVTIFSMPFDETIPIAYQQTSDGSLIQKLPIIKNLISKADFSGEVFTSHSKDNDFQVVSKDTLFHYNIKKNILEPKVVFNFPGEKIGSPLRELPLHYFGTAYIKKNENEYDKLPVIINKKTLKASFYEIVNDFYGGISCNLYKSNRGMFIDSKVAIELIDEIKQVLNEKKVDEEMKQKLEEILNRLHENDNDVLFLGKLKEKSD